MPSVQRVHEAFPNDDVAVVAISLDGGGVPTVQSYLAKHEYTFPTLVDQKMTVARALGARSVPYTLVINRQGAVVAGASGPFDLESGSFQQYIAQLAAEPRT